MKFNARISAAIECLDQIFDGRRAGQVLSDWGRAHRFAGSGDRNAIRDMVYDALRCRRSFASIGGDASARGVMIGWCLAQGSGGHESLDDVFSGKEHAPSSLTLEELRAIETASPMTFGQRTDWPDWLVPEAERSLGAEMTDVLCELRHRAPVFLRVNLLKSDVGTAAEALSAEGIETETVDGTDTALKVTQNPRRVAGSRAFRDGLVELQDAASQRVIQACAEFIPDRDVLDYCAGGGGKTLAVAAYGPSHLVAHDGDPRRMGELPDRLKRAGAIADIVHSKDQKDRRSYFDLVIVDAPCSGTGSWRRDPQAKWTLTQDRLNQLIGMQKEILSEAATIVRPGGVLVYATCSFLACENADQVDAFLANVPGWSLEYAHQDLPSGAGDGFYSAHLRRAH